MSSALRPIQRDYVQSAASGGCLINNLVAVGNLEHCSVMCAHDHILISFSFAYPDGCALNSICIGSKHLVVSESNVKLPPNRHRQTLRSRRAHYLLDRRSASDTGLSRFLRSSQFIMRLSRGAEITTPLCPFFNLPQPASSLSGFRLQRLGPAFRGHCHEPYVLLCLPHNKASTTDVVL